MYTFMPPFALWPREAVGEVCMETIAIRARGVMIKGSTSSVEAPCRGQAHLQIP